MSRVLELISMSSDDFDVASLASYLHISPAQAQKMAERGTLPARKVAGQWRFAASEVHHWLENRIGVADDEDLDNVEGVLRMAGGTEPIRICRLIPTGAMAIPLAARTSSSVIAAVVELAERTGLLWDRNKMIEAVKARENLHPTALENGVALLHPRRPLAQTLSEPLLALGITSQGIPFGESHGQLTDIFFLICSIDDAGHLRVLARLSRLISRDGFLSALRASRSEAEAREWIEQFEAELE
ncbi:MAG TPA: PTS sugar transporter subunit IIA [Pirellulaceae bacterium]|nr:PTS sugar transporter subunit IIA [Pirellulaceae bacterium]